VNAATHHNIAHHLSPSVVDAAAEEGVPQVQTLHDYKLVCPVYVLMREGRVCEECRGPRFEHVLLHRCNRGSLSRSAINFLEMSWHHRRGTYRRVDRFLCPSTFQMEVMRRFGWPQERFDFLPHFVRTAGVEESPGGPLTGGYLGRLSAEKGLVTLIEALRRAAPRLPRGWEFLIAGDGPLRAELAAQARDLPVRFLGHVSGETLEDFWRQVRFVVMPSLWYEVRPISLHEAFAHGKAAVASDLGSMPELVMHGQTGLLAAPGDADAWAAELTRAWAEPEAMRSMGRAARAMAQTRLTPEAHLAGLLQCYARAAA
jgi:glycosyltransferase involved in cell wall biosynthesis